MKLKHGKSQKTWNHEITAVKQLAREVSVDLRNPPKNAMLTPDKCAAWLRKKNRRALIRNKRIPKYRPDWKTILYHVGTVLEAIGPKQRKN